MTSGCLDLEHFPPLKLKSWIFQEFTGATLSFCGLVTDEKHRKMQHTYIHEKVRALDPFFFFSLLHSVEIHHIDIVPSGTCCDPPRRRLRGVRDMKSQKEKTT